MECPYCKAGMEQGFVKSTGYDLYWIKNGYEANMARRNVTEHGFFIADKGFNNGTQTQAYYCNKCKIVIMKAGE